MVKAGSKELKFQHNDCVVSSNSIILKKNWVSIVLFEANIIKLNYVIIKINNTKFQNELGKCKHCIETYFLTEVTAHCDS